MKLAINNFALAISAISGFGFTICSIIAKYWPDLLAKLYASLLHVSPETIARHISISTHSFIIGLVQTLIYTFVAAWIFGWLLNRYLYKNI